jgi:hypothetical protein
MLLLYDGLLLDASLREFHEILEEAVSLVIAGGFLGNRGSSHAPLSQFEDLLPLCEPFHVSVRLRSQLPRSVLLRGQIKLHQVFDVLFGPMSDQFQL